MAWSNLDKSEKILLSIFFVLLSIVVSYELFYIPSLPNASVVKEEFVFNENTEQAENTGDLININSASEDELTKIPGVGHSIAKRIIEYREQNGGFASVLEITNVSGIGNSKFNAMKDFISV